MSCDEHQVMISRLFDGELPPGASSGVFAHLAGCGQCQLFYHRLQALNASLEQIAGRERETAAGSTDQRRKKGIWRRRVSMRLPVLVFLLCAIAAGAVFSFFARQRRAEFVYVAKLPAVVVTPDMNTQDQLNQGEKR